MLFKFFSGKIIYTVLGCIFTIFILASCFSPWTGDDATIIINLGGTSGNRGIFENPVQDDLNLTYKVTLTGPSEVPTQTIEPGARETKISVVPGRWDIFIEAYSNGYVLYAKGGRENISIRAGQNRVSIDMEYVHSVYVDIIIDENINLSNDNNTNTIIITGDGNFTATVNCPGINLYDEINYNWYIWGSPIRSYENKPSITIYAKDYNQGTYQLMVVVLINDKPYSAETCFTVE